MCISQGLWKRKKERIDLFKYKLIMLIYHKYYIANPSLPVNLVFEFRNFATALSKQRRLLGGGYHRR